MDASHSLISELENAIRSAQRDIATRVTENKNCWMIEKLNFDREH
jgi:hypothetical protein